jgi:hypothetical protein
MPAAGHWHRHLPSVRPYRAENIPVNRNYVVADFGETEFLVRSLERFDNADKSIIADYRLPVGAIGAFSSPSLHRSPPLRRARRRTALVFLSHAINCEEPYSSNPMINKMHAASASLRRYLLSRWLENENIILGHAAPIRNAARQTHEALRLVT